MVDLYSGAFLRKNILGVSWCKEREGRGCWPKPVSEVTAEDTGDC